MPPRRPRSTSTTAPRGRSAAASRRRVDPATLPPPPPPRDFGRVTAEYLEGLVNVPALRSSRCILWSGGPRAFLALEGPRGAVDAEWFAFQVDDVRDLDSPRWLRREEVWVYLRFARTDGGNPLRYYTRGDFVSASAAFQVTLVRWRTSIGSPVELTRSSKAIPRRQWGSL